MIIQRVIKGISGISRDDADNVLEQGVTCNWWRNVKPPSPTEIAERLTERNLFWHQNRYSCNDLEMHGAQFFKNTPFISTTAGTVERNPLMRRNIVQPAWLVALEFATDSWNEDAYLFYCYLFILGRPTVAHQQFSEELRELNVYTGYSPYQPEGEITAKIIIPPTQIEKYSFYSIASIKHDLDDDQVPKPDFEKNNVKMYKAPEEISNIRDVLS